MNSKNSEQLPYHSWTQDDPLPEQTLEGFSPEYSIESYSVVPLTDPNTKTTVWLHSSARKRWNLFKQENWSKAWTTKSKDGNDYVDVSELTTWLYSYIEDGNNTKHKTIYNGHYVEQGPYVQDHFPWPGFTPHELCHRAWCKGPRIETNQQCF
ncbi:hypothetical protein [Bacillus sp. NTK034]|uniref:hypothetical protein n=1 Tax=Bacillus sp. NTK034 TaxID=2802176 RepID=UPI001A8EF775|nr:hypothetical protein [Bacillus sp. NTK034]MBN8203174.1 hypothetical protein [Bacillus sp. NTK034]